MDTEPVPLTRYKPGTAVWTSNGRPRIPGHSKLWTRSDCLAHGFLAEAVDWSLDENRRVGVMRSANPFSARSGNLVSTPGLHSPPRASPQATSAGV